MWPYGVDAAKQAPALVIRAENPKYFSRGAGSHVVVYVQGGQPFLHIEFLVVKPAAAGQGLGTKMFWRIARACLSLKIRKVTLVAIGGREVGPSSMPGDLSPRRWTGYAFWPGLGFDGKVPSSVRTFAAANFPHHPPGIATKTRVRQFYGSRDEEAFWRLCGATVSECEFDMFEGSASVDALINRVETLYGVKNG
ncbi:GNAT family N-acetyltransferase [Paraburkholderia tropica]|uniref:GNAT family N-acetyltransferase n=1 Tax=Paraburkholderia tropica TaxID=92647 RepID=UPI00399CD2F3